MLISQTKRLADALKIKVFEVVPIRREPLYEWHANLFVYNRRKGVILMNNKTRYSVVLYGLTAEHFRQFKTLAVSAIEQTFRAEGVSADVIKKYLRTECEPIFIKSYDRSILGQMNYVLYHVEWRLDEQPPLDDIYMVEISKAVNRIPLTKHFNYGFAIEVLREELNNILGCT